MLSTVEKRYSAGELGGIWRSSPFFFFFLWRVFGARWVFYLYTLVRERVPAVSSRRGAGVPARHYRRNWTQRTREVYFANMRSCAYILLSMHTLRVVCIHYQSGSMHMHSGRSIHTKYQLYCRFIYQCSAYSTRVVLSRNIHRTSCTTVQASTWIWGLSSEEMKFTSKTVCT